MNTEARAGLRAARALLSLIEENSPEDFEAAEAILGADEQLVNILQLLRKFNQHQEQPLSVEKLREIVRSEIVDLGPPVDDLLAIAQSVLPGAVLRTRQDKSVEGVIDRALEYIEAENNAPSDQAEAFILLLIRTAVRAGPAHMAKVTSRLRDLAIQALTENVAMFPTLHTLAQLRTHWAGKPLFYEDQDSRRTLVARLLTDAERGASDKSKERAVITHLLLEGLRSPADGAIAAVRKMKSKKAHGE